VTDVSESCARSLVSQSEDLLFFEFIVEASCQSTPPFEPNAPPLFTTCSVTTCSVAWRVLFGRAVCNSNHDWHVRSALPFHVDAAAP
jgi:hypothetical protein